MAKFPLSGKRGGADPGRRCLQVQVTQPPTLASTTPQ